MMFYRMSIGSGPINSKEKKSKAVNMSLGKPGKYAAMFW